MKCAAVIVENRPELVAEAVKKHLPLLQEDWRLIHLSLPQINSISQYNILMTRANFWMDLINFDRVLIFQHDSCLLKKGIEEFLKWDYVGAPWNFQLHGGNGGLSIRNPRVMAHICSNRNFNIAVDPNEDVWFSNIMFNNRTENYNMAPRFINEEFSCESIYREGTLGYHAIEKWLTPEQCQKIKNQYGQN